MARYLPPRARVLILGCGTGALASELTGRGYRCLGVDDDPDAIAQARARDPRTPWALASLATLVLPGRSFDAVIADGHALDDLHGSALAAALSHVAAHLSTGGTLVAQVTLTSSGLQDARSALAYERACEAAGLSYLARHHDWVTQQPPGGDGHAMRAFVAVHRRR